jgi:hypothetical protein
MPEEQPLVDTIALTYAKQAAWMSSAAKLAFEVAERVLIVGAVKYAAAALPSKSPSKDTLNAVAEGLHAVLLYWLLTKLWAQSSSDYKTFHHAQLFKRKWARWTYRAVALLLVCGFAYWMNRTIHDLVQETVSAFARPEGH